MTRPSPALAVLALAAALAACRGAPLVGGRDVAVPGLRIEGATQVDPDDLVAAASRYLRAFVANDRRPADADDAAFAMETLLRERGYPQASVAFAMPGRELVFHVEEGPRATLGRVRLEGVESVSRSELDALFDRAGSGFLALGPPWVVPAEIRKGVARVEAYYHERGYVRVEIDDPALDWHDGHTVADVVVRIREGARYTLEAVHLDGVPASYLRATDFVGKPFTWRRPSEIASSVRHALEADGYALADVEARADVDDDRARAVVHVTARPGEVTRLGSVRFEGAAATRRSFLRDRFHVANGQPLLRRDVEEGVADLYRSRLFRSVEAVVEPVSPGWADVAVDLEAADTKQVDVEVGWGTWEMLRGRVLYKDFNLFGIGRVLRAAATASLRSAGGSVEVEDPWILGQDNRLYARAEVEWREQRFYDYRHLDLRVAAERRFDRRNRLEAGYHFSLEEASSIQSDLPDVALEELEGLYRAAGLYALYRYDDRDDPLLPTRGPYLEAGVRWSLPPLGADLSFVSVGFEGSWTWDLGAWGGLAVGASWRTVHPYSGDIVPIQERVFLGGGQSVRGFGEDELTPIDADGNGVGALTAGEAHLEWRRRIVSELHGALFYDLGFVSLDSFATSYDLGHAVGAGLRFYTPVGPIRLDLGYNPGALFAADERWHLYFSFGFSF